jgi:hypothetical protein
LNRWPFALVLVLACSPPRSQPRKLLDGAIPSEGTGGGSGESGSTGGGVGGAGGSDAGMHLGPDAPVAGSEAGTPAEAGTADVPAGVDVPVGTDVPFGSDVRTEPPPDSSGPLDTGSTKLPNGAACSAASACVSTLCADGVCCESACSGQCEACGPQGKCAAVTGSPVGGRPACAGQGVCAGSCDGSNRQSCRYPAAEKQCASASCQGSTAYSSAVCDGTGACLAQTTVSCSSGCAGSICVGGCSASNPCPGDQFCSASKCFPRRSEGVSCIASDQCTSNHCVDGVCCDSPCADICYSCRMATTGTAEGHCAPSKAGIPHSGCLVSTPSTCGLDGKCDGIGNCRKYPAGTTCKTESCPQGSSTHSTSGSCDGNGACSGSSMSSCMNFLCDATSNRCKTTCADSAADCISSTYCSGSSCVPKKAPGQPCASPLECSSNLCGGACCNPGIPCSCTSQSAANLLTNAGFDQNLDGWTQGPGNGSITHTSDDYEGCPGSGSARITVVGPSFTRLEQCVPLDGDTWTYYFNVKGRNLDSGTSTNCEVHLFTDNQCSSAFTHAGTISVSGTTWGPGGASKSFQPPAPAFSAAVSCQAQAGGPGGGAAEIDFVYLGKTPGMF